MELLGIDVGGTGIKGAIINTVNGQLVSKRKRLPTPGLANPQLIVETIVEIIRFFNWNKEIGCAFPSVIEKGVVHTASNIDRQWIGLNAANLLTEASGCPTYLINDADAAGKAEIAFGSGQGKRGNLIFFTVGTGIGSAFFHHGHLYPNTELGFLKIKGRYAEHYIANSIREAENLSWSQWGKRFSRYLKRVELLLTPDLFILGGGISKKFKLYESFLKCKTPIIPAQLKNNAGIIGAAVGARDYFKKDSY
ncbi:MAG: polyphosphate glucokinase [Flammeovirgaceae bacterium]|nr:polyphosphate glucokinase [Flammeovirgaceae bacterium]